MQRPSIAVVAPLTGPRTVWGTVLLGEVDRVRATWPDAAEWHVHDETLGVAEAIAGDGHVAVVGHSDPARTREALPVYAAAGLPCLLPFVPAAPPALSWAPDEEALVRTAMEAAAALGAAGLTVAGDGGPEWAALARYVERTASRPGRTRSPGAKPAAAGAEPAPMALPALPAAEPPLLARGSAGPGPATSGASASEASVSEASVSEAALARGSAGPAGANGGRAEAVASRTESPAPRAGRTPDAGSTLPVTGPDIPGAGPTDPGFGSDARGSGPAVLVPPRRLAEFLGGAGPVLVPLDCGLASFAALAGAATGHQVWAVHPQMCAVRRARTAVTALAEALTADPALRGTALSHAVRDRSGTLLTVAGGVLGDGWRVSRLGSVCPARSGV
ncbi:hypothetical protein [Streptomyces sp. NBC_00083]|uniref:hypothetical protein n=1 Tax=Streptomyces sp. NBC_00083 TaxID=2975647 RepID=UPI00224D33D3|nr:hypothetical protein [Streptomyces sp. NBC_00083]MCX5384374.1 hypothetical protein [Streptomyces sp. NBC_00083]